MVVGGVKKNDNMKENHNKGSIGNPAYWVPSGLVSGAEGKQHTGGR